MGTFQNEHNCHNKNEPSRFLGEGVSFKAKLIGILEVSEARGDRMCQEALADLKMAIRAAGEHKQRITINIAIDGLRLRDEKTGDSLYHHPVHKISFIAQDMSDSRAFGYIFGSPDTGHRFFGIKTDKAASQVVIAMRDLFQVVFELKKKEIELAKQHIEQKTRFGSSNNTSSLFSSSENNAPAITTAASTTTVSSNNATSKSYQNEGESHHNSTTNSSKLVSVSETTSKASGTRSEGASARPAAAESAIADLVDLELELSSIQQGIHQMERITPSDPFGPNKDDPFNSDPFGDSFTSYPQKPFLPPPPPSARDRPSRNASAASDSSSIFSPKTPRTGAGSVDTSSQEAASLFRTSQDEPTSGWFTPTGGNDSLFEDAVSGGGGSGEGAGGDLPPQPSHQKETNNASILSQFDVFTELDPLGTGRSKPYIDKKLFFQELKNPPKKVLKDLVTETVPADSTLFCANFDSFPQPNSNSSSSGGAATATATLFQTDPFAEGDPFQDEFAKAAPDPFDTDFVFNKSPPDITYPSSSGPDKLQPLFPVASNRNRSPSTKNPSLDISSESESAPEPPPRPASNLTPIKPPPLPPKKQPGDLAMKPPPRPPHTEDSHYDYMDHYETGFATVLDKDQQQTPPLPVPARKSRFDSDFSTSSVMVVVPPPQRPKKFQHSSSIAAADDNNEYLQPIAPPKKHSSHRIGGGTTGPILLPPPSMKKDSSKRTLLHNQNKNNQSSSLVTVASYLESKPKLTSTTASCAADKLNLTPDTLDITLSQLTLSGLNELAKKLNIPASQLSNMTLVQLTTYLSNYMKGNTNTIDSGNIPNATTSDATFPTFKADFAANFNDMKTTTAKSEPYDRYAVFRELLQQEEEEEEEDITTNDNNNEIFVEEEEIQHQEEEEEDEDIEEKEPEEDENNDPSLCKATTTPPSPDQQTKEMKIENSKEKQQQELKPVFEDNSNKTDRYAALRDIIIEDVLIPSTEVKEKNNVEMELRNEQVTNDNEQNDLNQDLKQKNLREINKEDANNDEIVESNIIEYDHSKREEIKSPVTEIIQTSNHHHHHVTTSGSVSDAVSGSSPEVDNVQDTTTAADTANKNKKNVENTARESWAIFDTPRRDAKEKQAKESGEEGVSPWSSDSKEFGNGSPSEWQQRRDSGSEGDWNRKRRNRDGMWWENQADIKGHYDKTAPSRVSTYNRERRSTDSYDDEWYEPDRPRRRIRQQASAHMWSSTGGGERGGGAGGQSSSSRDVSPWEEEEPSRTRRDREDCWPPCSRRGRGPSYDRERMRRRDDSWDEEDDYEYDEDEYVGKFHWPAERHNSRDSERASRDSDRHNASRGVGGEVPDHHWGDGGVEQWPPEERRHVRRRGGAVGHPQDDRWCSRAEWDHENEMVCGGGSSKEKIRFGQQRWPQMMRERKQREADHRYYKRDHSQESPWEDDYSNDPDEPHSPRYLSATSRRSWKRPSSASEMDRKSGEIKSRAPYYVSTGGSDGERDRKYRSSRRSRSRDSSQFSEVPPHQRHKPDSSSTLGRYSHRSKMYGGQKFENDFSSLPAQEKVATLGRKAAKAKELPSPKIENEHSNIIVSKTRNKQQQHLMFENDFVNSETDSPIVSKTKFNFENDFETSEAESPINRHDKSPKGHATPSSTESSTHKRGLKVDVKHSIVFESDVSNPRKSAESQPKSAAAPQAKQQKSLFEDDFSPTEKPGTTGLACVSEDSNGITVIAEEEQGLRDEPPARVSFTENNLDKTPQEVRRQNKHILAKRMSSNIRSDGAHIIIKKSESVNIFARENDPFDDDDFFSGRDCDEAEVTNVDNLKGLSSPNSATVEFKWTEDFDSFEIPEEK